MSVFVGIVSSPSLAVSTRHARVYVYVAKCKTIFVF